MVMYKKVYDPSATSRRLNVIVRHPDTLAGLSEIPYRQEAPLIDYILQEWMQRQAEGKSVQEAVSDGTLLRNIEAALYQAKKGRVGQSPAAPQIHQLPEQPRPAAVSVSSRPELVSAPLTVAAASASSAKNETQGVTHHETLREAAHETMSDAQGIDEEPPAPPPGIADRLSGMFDT